jgi:16S rRNA (cytidine1402-2'-O)-methyltransferase
MCDSERTNPSPGIYVIATPIGNLGDLSPRAAFVLANVAVLACEDTRTTRRLLGGNRLPRLVSLTEHNTEQRIPVLLAAAREQAVGLASDAGTPAIADPGSRVVAAAHEAGIPVYSVPGPSAVVAAVAASGFDGSDVHFLGFLPRKPSALRDRLRRAATTAATLVAFESPNRLSETLQVVAATLADPPVLVSREISKLHEEHVRGRASELVERFEHARGECVLVIQSPPPDTAGVDAIAAYLGEMRRAGARRSQAAAEAARRFGCTRDEAYALWE